MRQLDTWSAGLLKKQKTESCFCGRAPKTGWFGGKHISESNGFGKRFVLCQHFCELYTPVSFQITNLCELRGSLNKKSLRFTVLYVISGFATMTFGNDPKTIERGLQRDLDEKGSRWCTFSKFFLTCLECANWCTFLVYIYINVMCIYIYTHIHTCTYSNLMYWNTWLLIAFPSGDVLILHLFELVSWYLMILGENTGQVWVIVRESAVPSLGQNVVSGWWFATLGTFQCKSFCHYGRGSLATWHMWQITRNDVYT